MGRFHYQDNVRFCIIARGSLSETLDHLIIAHEANIVTSEVLQSFQLDYDHCLKLLNGYIQYLKRKKDVDL
jgi:four helix bundle protein